MAEQTKAFDECAATHGSRRCAFLFELLEPKYGDVFFHCDQVIRGVYEPFMRDWHAALADGLLVLRVEDLLDSPAQSRRRLLDFLGLPAVDGAALPAPEAPYAVLHARSLRAAKAEPMLAATRVLAERFYAPHNGGARQAARRPRPGVAPWIDRRRRCEARRCEVFVRAMLCILHSYLLVASHTFKVRLKVPCTKSSKAYKLLTQNAPLWALWFLFSINYFRKKKKSKFTLYRVHPV